jgi:alkanesulfonate monooxygenase
VSYFEPLTLWAALSAVTRHIGFVATASTTYEEPYLLARKFAALDHLSKGRAAWNVVTTSAENVHGNFGLDAHPDSALRYERAHEFVEVVKGLWDSFDDDAFVRDASGGVHFDPGTLHTLNHVGKHFQVQGPLNLERPVQGHPVIVQAGSSEDGRELAASIAEAIFTAWTSAAEAQAFYKDVKGRLGKYGRAPQDLLVLPGICPVVGCTDAEARAKWAELQALIHPSVGLNTLAPYWPDDDLRRWDLDAPPPLLPAASPGREQPRARRDRAGAARALHGAPAVRVPRRRPRALGRDRHARRDRRPDAVVVRGRRGRRVQRDAPGAAAIAERIRRPGDLRAATCGPRAAAALLDACHAA